MEREDIDVKLGALFLGVLCFLLGVFVGKVIG